MGDEHIIPEALGGNLLIPEASCAECERIINQEIERPLIRGLFAPARALFGFPSKRPSKRPKEVLTPFVVQNAVELHPVSAGMNPHLFVMHGFKVAGIFKSEPLADRDLRNRQIHVRPFDTAEGHAKMKELGATGLQAGWADDDTVRMGRLIAKIAHALAFADGGGDWIGFQQVLPPLILGKPSLFPLSYLIGGMAPAHVDEAVPFDPASPSTTHQLQWFENEAEAYYVMCVRVRLFANWGAPSYCGVVGVAPISAKATITNRPWSNRSATL